VRQTTVLVGQIATHAGLRAPLADVADQVFLDLVAALDNQGLPKKVAADMFGMALRSYQAKVRRLTETHSDRRRSLWESLLAYVQERKIVKRVDIVRHFRHYEEPMIRSVLRDLVGSGLIFKTGRSHTTAFRAASDEELGLLSNDMQRDGALALVWLSVYRCGPINRDGLSTLLTLEDELIDELINELVAQNKIDEEKNGDERVYTCSAFSHELGAGCGWEAAVFDHYQALVSTIVSKLQGGGGPANKNDLIGGSTYSFDIWDWHEWEERVDDLMKELRRVAGELLSDVVDGEELDGQQGARRVVFYIGQNVIRGEG